MDEFEGFFTASEARRIRPTPSMLPRCDQCKLHEDCKSPKMKPSGNGRRRVLLVGEYPGKNEDAEGLQFVGSSGQLLEDILRRMKVNMREDCWLHNATVCYSPEISSHKTAVMDCRPNLLNAIKKLSPEVIVLMGKDAIKSLVGYMWKEGEVDTVSRWVGWTIPGHKPNAWVCPTYNPAYLQRSRDQVIDDTFERHLKTAFSLSGRPWPQGPPNYEAQVDVLMNVEEAAQRLSKYTSGVVAFDYETNCLKPDGPESEIVCCSVCWNGLETIAFPWHGPVKKAMSNLLINPDVGKIAAQLQFEDRWSREHLGIEVEGWVWDTMLAAHAIDPRSISERDPSGTSGLKFQAFARLGCPDYSSHIEPYLDSPEKGGYVKNRIREVSVQQLLKYCGIDSLLEYELAQLQMKDLGVSHGR